MADDFSFQIIEELGSISESKAGWKTDQIKAEADYVTSTNDEHGVAKAILKFCFGE